jgi:hypothetical protein
LSSRCFLRLMALTIRDVTYHSSHAARLSIVPPTERRAERQPSTDRATYFRYEREVGARR